MMTKNIKTIYRTGLLILGLLAITTGCSDDLLDLKPETTWAADEFYGNETDINAALAGIHSSLGSYNTFGFLLPQMDSGTDEAYKLKSWNEKIPVSINAHNPASEEVTKVFQSLYGGINNCNNMIKYINPDNFDNIEIYNNYLAEAKFLRGFMYYYLTIWWNEIPLRLEPSNDQSSNHLAPSPVNEVYEAIIADLTFASENLYSSAGALYVPGHASKEAAHGMLAKVYLKAAGYPLQATEINGRNPYQAAKDHCAAIMNGGNNALNPSYKDVFLNYIQNRFDLQESLFEICYRNGTDLGINIAGRNGSFNGLFYNIKGDRNGEPYGQPEITPGPIHEYMYEENDSLRQHWNAPMYSGNKNQWNPNGVVQPNPHTLAWGYTVGKFRRWDAAYPWDLEKTNAQLNPIVTLETPAPLSQHVTGINYPILRYSDVLLMFAEAENELNGPTGEAQAAIDAVRNRAGLNNLAAVKPEAIAGKDAFFVELTDERMRELCFEGHRRMDLVRWGLYEEKLNVHYESILYHPNYTPAEAYKYRAYTNYNPAIHLSLPYPEQEVLINNLLEQKPAW